MNIYIYIYIYIYSCASHCQNKILLKATKNMRNYSKDIGWFPYDFESSIDVPRFSLGKVLQLMVGC